MSKHLDILDAVANEYGIRFEETNTGGGCIAYEYRLPSGDWIVATNEILGDLKEQVEWESENDSSLGMVVMVYPNSTELGEDWWGGGQEPKVEAFDEDGRADDLPRLVGEALAKLNADSKPQDLAGTICATWNANLQN